MNPITRGMNNFCEGLVNSSHANYISSSQSTYIPPPPPVFSYTPPEHKPVENIRSYTQPSEMKLPLFSPSLVSYQPSYLPSYLPKY